MDKFVSEIRATRVLMTGCAADTAEESRAAAIQVARDSYAHHDHITVVTVALCETCGGSGQVSRKRGKKVVPYSWHKCEACKGEGGEQVGETVEVTR